MNRTRLGALLATAALALCGCGGASKAPAAIHTPAPPAAPTTATVSGSISVRAANPNADAGVPCRAADGYTDIHEGAQVELTDAGPSGGTLGLADLQPSTHEGIRCVFTWTISNVPLAPAFYAVHIGNVSRGQLKVPRAEISTPVELTLG